MFSRKRDNLFFIDHFQGTELKNSHKLFMQRLLCLAAENPASWQQRQPGSRKSRNLGPENLEIKQQKIQNPNTYVQQLKIRPRGS